MIPWTNMIIRQIVPYHPYTQKSLNRGLKTLDKRMSVNGLIRKDIFFHLMDEDGESGHAPLSRDTLASEAMLVLIAGSDTTAVALTNIFFYLLTHPDVFARLLNEVEKAVPPEVQYPDAILLAQLPYLRAVMNETLRLHPAVPGGAHRRPPLNGRPGVIGDLVIPQGTTVQIPTWNVHRDPRYFWPHPETFWPERWLEDTKNTTPEFRLNTTAYMPFSFGPTSCVGKHLASNEIRLAAVTLIRNFDIKLNAKIDPHTWAEKQDELFVLLNNELPVVITPKV
jgi:cytochrome P450